MRIFVMVVLAVALLLTVVGPALACDMPTPGPGYGQFTANMAQMCSSGSMLGHCISTMANGSCTCDGMMGSTCTCNMGM